MNIQHGPKRIGWTEVPRSLDLLDEDEWEQLPGATWNPTAGCFHGCTWESRDGGAIAECYAKGMAEGVARQSYPDGFESHYWHSLRLREPFVKKKPHGIFVGSMGDLFGSWVPEYQILTVMDVMRGAHWHTFLVLTKNPKRLREYSPFPANVWVGMSLPTESREKRGTAIFNRLHDMAEVEATVRFLSAEPLWWNAGGALRDFGEVRGLPLDWVIVGAMSRGAKVYQPERLWVENMLSCAGDFGMPVYMKSNLKWEPRLTEFPMVKR